MRRLCLAAISVDVPSVLSNRRKSQLNKRGGASETGNLLPGVVTERQLKQPIRGLCHLGVSESPGPFQAQPSQVHRPVNQDIAQVQLRCARVVFAKHEMRLIAAADGDTELRASAQIKQSKMPCGGLDAWRGIEPDPSALLDLK